jgi:hypothetical protein
MAFITPLYENRGFISTTVKFGVRSLAVKNRDSQNFN